MAKNSSLKTDILYSESIVSKDFFEKDCEFKAYKLIKELEKLNSLPDWDYLKMFNLFEINVSNLNELFDNKKGVLFMTENKEIRNNRLNLIAVIRNYSLKIADFTLLNY